MIDLGGEFSSAHGINDRGEIVGTSAGRVALWNPQGVLTDLGGLQEFDWTADPFALRRGALGILNILAERDWDLSLGEMVNAALEGLNKRRSSARWSKCGQVLDFLRGRLKGMLTADGASTDLIEAVISAGFEKVPRCGEAAGRAEEAEQLR